MSTQPENDNRWMQRALELARRGIGLCSPNPVVGCVILDREGQLAGEGWHEYDRLDHAEVAALRQAGEQGRGGTAYVTLEPCNHTGRTGPCSHALIQAGVARVVAATADPHPIAAGGLQALQAAGLQTEVGVCEAEARLLNEGFARWSQSRRPFVRMKVAMSADGRIAPPPARRTTREPFWLTGEAARAAVQTLRHQADAVLTGIGTVLADNPLLTDRSGLPRRRPLLRVVLDSALRLPLDCNLAATSQQDVMVFTVCQDQARIRALTEQGVRVEVLPPDSPDSQARVPLGAMLDRLGAEGILTLLAETGSALNSALMTAGLVDRLDLFLSPQLLGSEAVPAFEALPGSIPAGSFAAEGCGEDLWLRSLLRDPWERQGS